MKRLEHLVFIIVFTAMFSCDSDNVEHKSDWECFKEFGEFRMNLYLSEELDGSFRQPENWYFIVPSQIVGMAEPTAQKYSLDNSRQDFDSYYRISVSDSYYIPPEGLFYLGYGNGAIDTISFQTSGLSGSDCTATWVNKVFVNGDSLIRDFDNAFRYVKQ